jgi:cell wall-associated NlpC family hydrolase
MKHARHVLTVACLVAAPAALASPASAGTRFGDRTLHKGSRGHDVRVLQSWLTHLGVRTTVDGVFGSRTRSHLRRFERRNHMRADGRLTRGEARKMRRLMASYSAQQGQDQQTVPTEDAQIIDQHTAVAPESAPQEVKDVIAAANEITSKPYRYGGGHGRFTARGYDCSGAVSYALHGGGFLDSPLDSTGFYRWGKSGRGNWITVYTKSSHAYLIVAGIRFDTSGRGEDGPRWRKEARSSSGYRARHPQGL